ncbi:type II toxin-antitoxin system RelE/ParE family toxin [Companilactobacillus sp. HBUAS59544]|uniref:type II toxin-antitoxin system RelE/ParE family toxin n=1 Tax=Companilactobacillus sp. HBUAS59544 TaxID=3109363 RepID=UPI002FF35922
MRISYKNRKVEKQCESLKEAKKAFSEKIAKKLLKLVNFIKAAENLESIIKNPFYKFHKLKGDKEGLYALDIDGRKSSYRLLVAFDGMTSEYIFEEAISIVSIQIEEVSKHYE